MKLDCPICHQYMIQPAGFKSSPILIVGEFPGDDEMLSGKPFVGATGKIFRRELSLVDIDLQSVRVTNLWLHPEDRKSEFHDECLNWMIEQLMEEAKGRDAILLLGSTTVKELTGYPVLSVAGLEVESEYLDAPLIMACPQPAIMFHSSVGEVKLSLKKFANKLKERNLL